MAIDALADVGIAAMMTAPVSVSNSLDMLPGVVIDVWHVVIIGVVSLSGNSVKVFTGMNANFMEAVMTVLEFFMPKS